MMRRRSGLLIAVLVVIAVTASASVVYAARSAGTKASAAVGLKAGVAAGPRSEVAPAVTGNCKSPRTDFATHEDQNGTTSTVFVDIPGASVSFLQHGTVAGCVVVNFTSMSWTPGDLLFVRALLDGATAGTPSETQFSGDDGVYARSYSMDFVFPVVPPGPHILQMQFRSNGGGDVFIHRGVTSVNHR
jgi:hypothetical protein